MSARFLTVAALLTSFAVHSAVGQAHPNFAGSWMLNTKASDPMGGPGGGGMAGAAAMPITIIQSDSKFAVERKFNEQTITTTYNLDGTESINSSQRGDSKSVAKWVGAALVVTTTSANGMVSTETRTLSADGKQMTVVREGTGQNGPTKRTTVYDKQ